MVVDVVACTFFAPFCRIRLSYLLWSSLLLVLRFKPRETLSLTFFWMGTEDNDTCTFWDSYCWILFLALYNSFIYFHLILSFVSDFKIGLVWIYSFTLVLMELFLPLPQCYLSSLAYVPPVPYLFLFCLVLWLPYPSDGRSWEEEVSWAAANFSGDDFKSFVKRVVYRAKCAFLASLSLCYEPTFSDPINCVNLFWLLG